MAENIAESPNSSQSLTCPLCLDMFKDATLLTCGHTFCRKCLQMYDNVHKDLDHMVCPVCRKVTTFDSTRVAGLHANVTVKGLVDEQSSVQGGKNIVSHLKCTACDLGAHAVSYCTSCAYYLCDTCHDNHQKYLISFFKGHQILSMQDIIAGKLSIDRLSNKCSIHSRDDKDLFCEECKVYICLKCMAVSHREHKLKNQPDIERELQQKVGGLVERCKAKKTELEANIQIIEARRQEVHTYVEDLQNEVKQAYKTKAERLKENERSLLEEINYLNKDFDDKFDVLGAHDRQRIKSICSSVTLVANDRLGHLEKDSLAAHSVICDELDDLLKEATNNTSAADMLVNARETRFVPSEDSALDLGKVATSNICNVGVREEVDLPNLICGMTRYSADSVVITQYHRNCVDVVDLNGSRQQLQHLPASMSYLDIAFQRNGNTVISFHSTTETHVYTMDGSRLYTMTIPASQYYPAVSTSSSDEIIISNESNSVHIFDPTGTNKHTVPTKSNKPRQAFATKSGLIVISSCSCTTSCSTVRVYDMEGNAGDSLKAARDGEYLYPAVDSQDRVYVARVHPQSGTMKLTRYDIRGLNLEESVEYNELKLTLTNTRCYLVSLSPNMLAFACKTKLYFIEVSSL